MSESKVKVDMSRLNIILLVPKTTKIRLWTFVRIMWFATWVGGFGGVEIKDIEVAPPQVGGS